MNKRQLNSWCKKNLNIKVGDHVVIKTGGILAFGLFDSQEMFVNINTQGIVTNIDIPYRYISHVENIPSNITFSVLIDTSVNKYLARVNISNISKIADLPTLSKLEVAQLMHRHPYTSIFV